MRSSASTYLMAAAALLLLLSLSAAATSDTSGSRETPSLCRERSEEETRRLFTAWKADLGITYSSAAKEERVYARFKARLRRLDGCLTWPWERSEGEMRRIFMDWSARQGNTYNSNFAEQDAYGRFMHHLQRVDRKWHEAGYPAWSWDEQRSEEETRRIFVEWKAKNDKTYSSIADEERRYAVFKDALRDVDWKNAGYALGLESSCSTGINWFTDLTVEESNATRGHPAFAVGTMEGGQGA